MLGSVRNKVVGWTLLVGWLCAQSLAAAGNRPVIGKVVASSEASLNGNAVGDETTVLAGDTLSTLKGGGAIVSFQPAGRTGLSEESSVRFQNDSGRVVAQVLAGTLVTQTLGKSTAVVETPQYKVEAAEDGKTIYMVTVLPDQRTVVAARRGSVSITEISSGRSYRLGEGRYASIPASSAEAVKTGAQVVARAAASAATAADVLPVVWSTGSLSPRSLAVPGVVGKPTINVHVSALRPKPSPH